jgi:hypothetical protein
MRNLVLATNNSNNVSTRQNVLGGMCDVLYDFVPSNSSLPEEQYRSMWMDVLKVGFASCSCLRITPEFKMSTLEACSVDARLDIAGKLSRRIGNKDFLVLLCEAAKPKTRYNVSHKDYQKLAGEMLDALLTLLGLLRKAPLEERKRLRVYGMLLSGTLAELVIMYPIYDKNGKGITARRVLVCRYCH